MGPQVRVGLLVDSASVELSSTGGLEFIDPESGRRIGEAAPGEPVVVRSNGQGTLRVEAGGTPRETGLRLVSARPGTGGIVSIGGKPYRGTAVIRSGGPGRLTAINQVDMETYLLGVVPREIGNVGEDLLETAKAQAVAARTYAVRYMGRREALGFDVFATVQDQVYGGVEAEHGPVSRAVRETSGEILTFEGEPIQAFYSSTCAGHTASIHEVWPVEPRLPYLTSISDIDPGTGEAFCRSSNRFQWSERWTIAEFTEILSRTLADSLPAGISSVGTLRDLRVLARTPEGRIRSLAITTTTNTFEVGGDRIRWVFLRPNGPILNSSKFDVAVVRDAQGRPVEVVATGGGWGHAIGMCQVGAMGRARAGQDYRAILQAYYQGTSIRSLY
jgi:stage II sporulation protein D